MRPSHPAEPDGKARCWSGGYSCACPTLGPHARKTQATCPSLPQILAELITPWAWYEPAQPKRASEREGTGSYVVFGWFMKIPGETENKHKSDFIFHCVFPSFLLSFQILHLKWRHFIPLFFSSCLDPLFLHTQFLIFLSCFVFSFSFAPPSPLISLYYQAGTVFKNKQIDFWFK